MALLTENFTSFDAVGTGRFWESSTSTIINATSAPSAATPCAPKSSLNVTRKDAAGPAVSTDFSAQDADEPCLYARAVNFPGVYGTTQLAQPPTDSIVLLPKDCPLSVRSTLPPMTLAIAKTVTLGG